MTYKKPTNHALQQCSAIITLTSGQPYNKTQGRTLLQQVFTVGKTQHVATLRGFNFMM